MHALLREGPAGAPGLGLLPRHQEALHGQAGVVHGIAEGEHPAAHLVHLGAVGEVELQRAQHGLQPLVELGGQAVERAVPRLDHAQPGLQHLREGGLVALRGRHDGGPRRLLHAGQGGGARCLLREVVGGGERGVAALRRVPRLGDGLGMVEIGFRDRRLGGLRPRLLHQREHPAGAAQRLLLVRHLPQLHQDEADQPREEGEGHARGGAELPADGEVLEGAHGGFVLRRSTEGFCRSFPNAALTPRPPCGGGAEGADRGACCT